jgi:threonine dehydratase
VVYASPPEGGAQTALAHTARRLDKRATIFVAKRQAPHPRSLMAKALGAKVLQVTPGYLNVVRARARAYCAATGALLAPFGMDFPGAIAAIAQAARATGLAPAEVWCAAGSGVLARGLAQAWPQAERHVVQIGRAVTAAEVAGARIHIYPLPFGRQARVAPPFPSDPHYDAKAWEICAGRARPGALFWNVTGPAGYST